MMRAIAAAIARALRGILGVLWMPFEAVGNIFSGFGGGGGGGTQDNAALVAKAAAADEATKDMQMTADKAITLDEAVTVKRVCGRLLLGKPIAPETRISPALLDMLVNAPNGVLRGLAESDAAAVTEFVDGYREGRLKGRAAMAGIPEASVDAQFPGLASRVAAYKARSPKPDREPSEAWETPAAARRLRQPSSGSRCSGGSPSGAGDPAQAPCWRHACGRPPNARGR